MTERTGEDLRLCGARSSPHYPTRSSSRRPQLRPRWPNVSARLVWTFRGNSARSCWSLMGFVGSTALDSSGRLRAYWRTIARSARTRTSQDSTCRLTHCSSSAMRATATNSLMRSRPPSASERRLRLGSRDGQPDLGGPVAGTLPRVVAKRAHQALAAVIRCERAWSGRRDLNSRSPGPKPGALPS